MEEVEDWRGGGMLRWMEKGSGGLERWMSGEEQRDEMWRRGGVCGGVVTASIYLVLASSGDPGTASPFLPPPPLVAVSHRAAGGRERRERGGEQRGVMGGHALRRIKGEEEEDREVVSLAGVGLDAT